MMEVFYVEDDKTIADSVKEYLNRQNCKVAIFETVTAVKKHYKVGFLPLF